MCISFEYSNIFEYRMRIFEYQFRHSLTSLFKYDLKGKTCSKLVNGLNFYDLKKKLKRIDRIFMLMKKNIAGCLPLPINMYVTIIFNIICSETAWPIKAKLYVEDC